MRPKPPRETGSERPLRGTTDGLLLWLDVDENQLDESLPDEWK
jgi:hypothetical protein